MRIEYEQKKHATDEVTYKNFERLLEFRIGDIRNYHSVCSVLRGTDIVINAAALKQVPSCEYFPFEAVQTNIIGVENIVRAISENNMKVRTVVGVSTDTAQRPGCYREHRVSHLARGKRQVPWPPCGPCNPGH